VNEQQLIQDAAEAVIKQLFNVFFQAYTAALGDATGQQRAEATFRAGVLHARHVMTRALASLPP